MADFLNKHAWTREQQETLADLSDRIRRAASRVQVFDGSFPGLVPVHPNPNGNRFLSDQGTWVVGGSGGGGVTDHGQLEGLDDDDHPQYILRSILTSTGDLLVRLPGGISRLAVGSNGYVLKAVGGVPTWTPDAAISDHGLLSGLSDDDHPQYVLRSTLTADGDLYTRAGGVITRIAIGNPGQIFTVGMGGVGAWADRPTTVHTKGAAWNIGSTPPSPVPVFIDFDGEIESIAVLTRGGSGSCTVDIWKDAYASYPPTSGDTILPAPISVTGVKYLDQTLTGVDTTVTPGDVLMFDLSNVSTYTFVGVYLSIRESL